MCMTPFLNPNETSISVIQIQKCRHQYKCIVHVLIYIVMQKKNMKENWYAISPECDVSWGQGLKSRCPTPKLSLAHQLDSVDLRSPREVGGALDGIELHLEVGDQL